MKCKVFGVVVFVLIVIVLLALFLGFSYEKSAKRSSGQGFSPFNASVTLLIFSNPPNITSYFPLELNFSASGDANLYFNATYEDQDGQSLDALWYVDNSVIEIDENDVFAEFNYVFGCGVSGEHNVVIEVTDGILNDSVQWNVSVGLVDCPPGGTDGGTGGTDGGTTGDSLVFDFSLDPELIEVELFPGGTEEETVVVENTGDFSLLFNLTSSEQIDLFVSLSEDSFLLSPGELNPVDINFAVDVAESPAVHTGTVVVKTSPLTKFVNLVIQILDVGSLFDLESELRDDTLTKQQQLETKITMTDIAGLGKVDVFLEYFIIDFADNAVKVGEETIEVEDRVVIERVFPIPLELELGDHVFSVKLTYQDKIATSANLFKLIDVGLFYTFWLFFIIILIVLVLIFLFFYSRRRDEEEKKEKKKKKIIGKVVLVKGVETENRAKIVKRHVREMIGWK